jgi:hypothetical protein
VQSTVAELFSLPGHDRDVLIAMISQVRLGHNPLDVIQVEHILAIGYRAGQESIRTLIKEELARLDRA